MGEPDLLQALNAVGLLLENCRELQRRNACLMEQTLRVQTHNETITKKVLVVKEQYEGARNDMVISIQEDKFNEFKDNLMCKVLDMEIAYYTVEEEMKQIRQESSELKECFRKMKEDTGNFLLDVTQHIEQQMGTGLQAQEVEVVPNALAVVRDVETNDDLHYETNYQQLKEK